TRYFGWLARYCLTRSSRVTASASSPGETLARSRAKLFHHHRGHGAGVEAGPRVVQDGLDGRQVVFRGLPQPAERLDGVPLDQVGVFPVLDFLDVEGLPEDGQRFFGLGRTG